jgi:MFS family permease
MTVFAGTTPFGALISGSIADHYGVPLAIGVGGLITAAAAIAIAWTQRQRTTLQPNPVVLRSS